MRRLERAAAPVSFNPTERTAMPTITTDTPNPTGYASDEELSVSAELESNRVLQKIRDKTDAVVERMQPKIAAVSDYARNALRMAALGATLGLGFLTKGPVALVLTGFGLALLVLRGHGGRRPHVDARGLARPQLHALRPHAIAAPPWRARDVGGVLLRGVGHPRQQLGARAERS